MVESLHAPQVQAWPVAKLVPYARNARTHTEAQVAQIAASIVEFGFTNPVLIAPDGEIIAGHGRVLAAKLLGRSEVPVIVLGHLAPAQRRAYVLADNRLALGAGWDEDLLRAELQALGEVEFDIGVIGFSDEELAEMFATREGGSEPDDTPDPPADPVSRLGDVWIMGQHSLRCGDWRERPPPAGIEAVITDPPYGIASSWKGGFSAKHGWRKAKGESEPRNEWDREPADVSQLLGVGKIQVIWGGNFFELPPSRGWLVWNKPERGFTLAEAELAWTNVDAPIRVIDAHRSDGGRQHPTQKPVVVLAESILKRAPNAQTIFDPFLGSGTTVIAAEMTGRRCIGIELNPAYVDVATTRWMKFVEQEAILEETGQTFSQVREIRIEKAA